MRASFAAVAFFVDQPVRVARLRAFSDGLNHQTTVADDALGKLGLTEDNGLAYYLWTITWGLGWVPAVAAAVGVVLTARDNWRLAAVLVPAPVLFLLFMGTQERFFGRWLMPVFPMVCLLAAYAVVRAAHCRRPPAGRCWRRRCWCSRAALLCGQGLVYSLHIGQVLSRDDTRNLARAWMVAPRAAEDQDRRRAGRARRAGPRTSGTRRR